jgi:endonuclease-3
MKIKPTPERVAAMLDRLVQRHPDAHCELDHVNPFQLIVAVVLSAQSTDVAVNKLTPALFEKYPDAQALAAADPKDVERMISRIGFFRNKTKSIVGLSKLLVEKHGGVVPQTLAELVQLPGVGRKTANVILGVAFQRSEGVVVDTHVQRLAQRLGWTRKKDPVEIEQDLMKLLPQSRWDQTAHVLIFHGRRVCAAIKPACAECPINGKDGFDAACPSAFKAEKVGRKPPRSRRPAPKKKSARKKKRR